MSAKDDEAEALLHNVVDFKKLQEVLVITTTKQDLIDNGNQTQSDSSEK